MSKNSPIISLKKLSYSYPGINSNALNEIDVDIHKGEFVVIMGPSLVGKSTFCFTLNGLIPHSLRGKLRGDVKIKGKSTKECTVAELSRDVALVIQDFEAQLFSTTAQMDVAFGPENFCLPKPEIETRVTEALSTVRLGGFEEREPASLSGGQKQRLAIAAALAMKSDILCMDEPTTDLDPIGKEEIFRVAQDIRKQGDKTVVFVEHEVEEALNSDRILIMREGKIIFDGSPKETLTKVEMLEQNGIRPLQVAKLFFNSDIHEIPSSTEEAYHAINSRSWVISEAFHQSLIEQDGERANRYGDEVITTSHLDHTFGDRIEALKDVNLSIRAGEFLAIIGQNGSGKTTLARHFNGLLKPTRGNVYIHGRDTNQETVYSLSKDVGYVFQNPDHMLFAETIEEEISFGPRNFGLDEDEIRRRVVESLAIVGMEGRENVDPFMLTKGERQRVALASVLATRPEIIILDEPTTGLDYREQVKVMELLRELNQSGRTVIIITHHLWTVCEYAHRAIVMVGGELLADGTVREIFAMEEVLNQAFLKPPEIPRLSNMLGKTLLSVEEMKRSLVNKKTSQPIILSKN
jgi:energy-coupling factor transport system ATP-binding protein